MSRCEVVGVDGGDDGDGQQVVDDRQREQEDPQGGRQEPPHDSNHGDGERDVRRGRDGPAAQRIGTGSGVDGNKDQGGRSDPADGGGNRHRRRTGVAELAGDELFLQLQSDDEEEDGQQTRRRPKPRR